MRCIIFIFLLGLYTSVLSAQQLQGFTSTHHFQGKGEIANSDISLELDFIFRYAYAEGCITKDYYQISGNYYYNKSGKPIHLLGELEASGNNYFSEVKTFNITLYELSSDYEKRALFQGKISPQDFQGEWIDQISTKRFPFRVNWEKSNLGNLKVQWDYREYILPGLCNQAYQGQYQLLYKAEKDHKLFLILRVTLPSCEVYNCKGSSCGGSDEYVYWCAIENQRIEWQQEIIARETPFLELTDTETTPDGCAYKSKDLEGNCFWVKADYQHPEKGLIKTPCN